MLLQHLTLSMGLIILADYQFSDPDSVITQDLLQLLTFYLLFSHLDLVTLDFIQM
ncbi:MAG: hypothetical protein RLZZ507_870 [Cyanobacteriota bacterium]|jgi:hypothetical protein